MESSFIIIREDLQIDPITIVGESILVGRLPTCELILNHPSVSRLQAGITNAQGDYYLRNLRPSNSITLNGQPVEQYQALAAGAAWSGTRQDAVRALCANPLVLHVELAERVYGALAAAHRPYLPERLAA